MNNTDEKKIQYFVALCDDLISCKFLVAESKIKKLLVALAETGPIYELVSDCMEMFNRDREMNKAFVTDGKGRFYCVMPNEEFKIIALVFCTLADIDEKHIDFTDFIKRFFDDEEGVNCYTSFARRMILPFRELVAEAFGLPKRYSQAQEKEQSEEELAKEAQEMQNPGADSLFGDCKNLAKDMLVELDENLKYEDRHSYEFKCVLEQIVKACEEKNYQLLFALWVGARYASKGIKCVKFLIREFEDTMNALALEFED